MKLTINAFQAFCGDCFLVSSQEQANALAQHIVIDAGYSQTYHRTLSNAVRQIVDKGERIRLFVLTHTDNDHLGGVAPFIKEFGTYMVDQFWMNHAPVDILAVNDGPVGVAKGITLRNLLNDSQKLNKEPILAGQLYRIDNISLSILSPNGAQYERLLMEWEAQERVSRKQTQPVSTSASDHRLPVDLLVQQVFGPDTSWSNHSSIAFLLSVEHFTALFTGDAHADVLVDSLKEMGYSEEEPARLDLLKVSHHGSRGNTNEALLRLVDCQHYIISTNGANNHQLPHKEALARIVTAAHRRRPDEDIHLYFTYNDQILRSIFSQSELDQYGICCHYPANHDNCVTLTYDC